MDIEQNVFIANEEDGHWKDDIWYSNNGYKDTYSRYMWTPTPKSSKHKTVEVEELYCGYCFEPLLMNEITEGYCPFCNIELDQHSVITESELYTEIEEENKEEVISTTHSSRMHPG